MTSNQAPAQPAKPLQVRAPQSPPVLAAAAELRSIAEQVANGPIAQVVEAGTTSEATQPPGSPGLQQDAGGASPSDQVEVDWNGARRRMSLKELANKAQAHDQAVTKATTVEEMLKKQSAAAAFVQAIESMPEEDQAAFAQVLQNPALARRLVNGQPPATQRGSAPTEQADLDEFVRGEDQTATRQPPSEELVTLQRGMKVLLQDLHGRNQQAQQQTMVQQVEASMNGFPVFGESSPGAKYARAAIMQSLAQNPGAKVDDVVAHHAVQLHGILQDQRQATVAPARNGEPRGSRQFQLPVLDREPTYKDLGSGGGLSAIGRALLGRS